MEQNQKIIKDDINFLEYPNWVIDRKNKATTWKIDKDQGKYEIVSPFGLPKHFDKIVLYFLLYKLYKESSLELCTLTTSRYEIAKSIFGGNHFGKNVYTRIMHALKRWQSISINFEGIFFEADGYTVRYFSIIDEVVLRKEKGSLTIRLNEGYITQLKETKFYKLIDFEQYKKLSKTSSARLYEILSKTYKGRDEWAIGIQALAEKLTFEKREGVKLYYPSDVLRYVKPGINEINKKTDLCIAFSYNKETGVCIFKKVKKQKETFTPATKEHARKHGPTKKEVDLCMKHFNLLPVEEQENILKEANQHYIIKIIPDKNLRIFALMNPTGKWKNPNDQ